MVTFTVVSDLHLEGRPLDLDEVMHPELRADVLCLLGDIGDPTTQAYRSFLAACADRFPTVLLLAGNNEYRNHHHHHHSHHHHKDNSAKDGSSGDAGGGNGHSSSCGRSMHQTEELIRAAAAAHPNVHFLQNAAHVVQHVAFIGTTLWSYLPNVPLPLPTDGGDGNGGSAAATAAAGGGGSGSSVGGASVAEGTALSPPATDAAAAAAAAATAALTKAAAATAADTLAAAAVRRLHEVQSALAAAPAPAGAVSRSNSSGGGIPSPLRLALSRWSPVTSPLAGIAHLMGPMQPGAAAAAAAAAAASQLSYGENGTSGSALAHSLPAPPSYLSRRSFAVETQDGGGDGDAPSAAGIHRRRLMLRHSVSLSVLSPDAPCPPLFLPGGQSREASYNSLGGSSSTNSLGNDDDGGRGSRSASSSKIEDDAGDEEHDRVGTNGEAQGAVTQSFASLALGPAASASAATSPHQLSTSGASAAEAAVAVAVAEVRSSVAAAPVAVALDTMASRHGNVTSSSSEPSAVAAEPAPESSRYQRHHHRHHHHHHDPPSGSGAANPGTATSDDADSSVAATPATIREYIGATSLDYRRILATPDGPAITPDVTNALFAASLEYLRTAVADARAAGLTPVVLSHHAPSLRGTSHPRFGGHPSTHAYGTDLEPYITSSGIAAWFCGHTHYNFDMMLQGGVRLASNQYGSQPQPAAGYSRTWRHLLPQGAHTTAPCPGATDTGSLAAAAAAAAGHAAAAANATTSDPSSSGPHAAQRVSAPAAALAAPVAAAEPAGAPSTLLAPVVPAAPAPHVPASPWRTSAYCHLASAQEAHALAPATA